MKNKNYKDQPVIIIFIVVLLLLLCYFIPQNKKVFGYKTKQFDLLLDARPDSVLLKDQQILEPDEYQHEMENSDSTTNK